MKKVCSNLWFMWKLCFKTAPGFMLYHLYDGFRLQIMIFLEHTLCIQYVLKCAEHGEDFVNTRHTFPAMRYIKNCRSASVQAK